MAVGEVENRAKIGAKAAKSGGQVADFSSNCGVVMQLSRTLTTCY
jgi:hypothetical protein